MSDILDKILLYILLAIPIISFLIVRKHKPTTAGTKIFLVFFLSLLFVAVLFVIASLIFLWS